MRLRIRKDKNEQWGIVESFKVYKTPAKFVTTVTLVVSKQGSLCTPYVLRGEEFISLGTIENEIGVEKYIKAKKPFYSMLSDGFIVCFKVSTKPNDSEVLYNESSYTVYTADGVEELSGNSGVLKLKSIVSITSVLDELLLSLMKDIALCNCNRLAFLKNRL